MKRRGLVGKLPWSDNDPLEADLAIHVAVRVVKEFYENLKADIDNKNKSAEGANEKAQTIAIERYEKLEIQATELQRINEDLSIKLEEKDKYIKSLQDQVIMEKNIEHYKKLKYQVTQLKAKLEKKDAYIKKLEDYIKPILQKEIPNALIDAYESLDKELGKYTTMINSNFENQIKKAQTNEQKKELNINLCNELNFTVNNYKSCLNVYHERFNELQVSSSSNSENIFSDTENKLKDFIEKYIKIDSSINIIEQYQNSKPPVVAGEHWFPTQKAGFVHDAYLLRKAAKDLMSQLQEQ